MHASTEEVASTQRWWSDRSPEINGIFKGGGAKGLLYAGAIREVAARGAWFRAVAGSSAGAITATLVAAGLTVEELGGAVPEALRRVRKSWLCDLAGQPFIKTDRLRTWLEEQLRNQLARFGGRTEGDAPVTFAQLYDATGIELYVVAVDVARRQPVVFSAFTTPALGVSAAVMASSAIPLAFRPGRLKFSQGHVHRLMDGGVWANYPAFVFKDRSFREHHDLPDLPQDSITIGFTLEHPVAEAEDQPTELLVDWTKVTGDKGSLLKGWLRIAPLRLYFMTIVPVVVAIQAVYTINHWGLLFLKDPTGAYSVPGPLEGVAAFFNGAFTAFWPGFIAVVVVIGLVAVTLAFVGATLLDSGVPAMHTLMAVGTNIPYWVGTTDGDHVVRLTVPLGLGTTSFRLDRATIEKAVQTAKEEAATQLEPILAVGTRP